MNPTITDLFFKNDLDVTINFDKDLVPYHIFIERQSPILTILNKTDRWLNLSFSIEKDKYYISITVINDSYRLFETKDNNLFVIDTTFPNTDILFNYLLGKIKQTSKYERKRLLTIA